MGERPARFFLVLLEMPAAGNRLSVVRGERRKVLQISVYRSASEGHGRDCIDARSSSSEVMWGSRIAAITSQSEIPANMSVATTARTIATTTTMRVYRRNVARTLRFTLKPWPSNIRNTSCRTPTSAIQNAAACSSHLSTVM